MLKTLTIRSCACILSVCLLSAPCLSLGAPASSVSTTARPIIGSDAWIEGKLRQYPELLWLTESNCAVNSSSNKLSYSSSLFGRKIPAFDATIRSLVYLHLFIQGSRQAYAQLTQLQPTDDVISLKQFQSTHKQLTHFLNSPKHFDNTLKILETAIVLKHIGLSAKAAAIFKPYFSEVNANNFYAKALHVLQAFPELLPSYSRLSAEQKEVLVALRRLADYDALLNFTQAPSAQFLSVGKSKRPLILLDLYLFSMDVCGEQYFSQEFYSNLMPLLSMLQQHATVEEAFSRYFTHRANRLGLESDSRNDMALVRLATLMELSPADAVALSWSFRNLPASDLECIVNTFYNSQGEHLPLNVRGLPELITGLLQANHGQGTSTASSQESRLRQIYSTALSLIVKSLRVHQDMLSKQLLEQATVLDFSETTSSCGGLDIFAENLAIRIHLNGSVSVIL